VQPPIRCRRILVSVLVSMLASVVGITGAGAVGNPRAGSLKISTPGTMARGSVLTVTASGFAGPYDTVSWSSEKGSVACATPSAGAITMQAVPRAHRFDVKLTNVIGSPGTLTVCVYLYSSGSAGSQSKGHYIVKSKRVKVA
jgi:hypothetical protein